MEQMFFPVTQKKASQTGVERSSAANKNAIFPTQLRDLRREKGVSQDELSKILGVSKSTLGLWETGDTLPDARSLHDLAVYYGVSADYLLGGSGVKTANPEIQAICKYTGLSEESINVLLDSKSLADSLNTMLQYRSFSYLLLAITQFGKMLTAASIYANVPNTSGDDDDSRPAEVMLYVMENNAPDDIRRAMNVYNHSIIVLKTLREGQSLLSGGEFGASIDEIISPSDIYESNANKNLTLLLEDIASDATLQGLIFTGKVK